jgi:hypothetical protein
MTKLSASLDSEQSLSGTITPAISVSYQMDNELSDVSKNPVQNRIITAALKAKKDLQLDESIETSTILKLFS